MRQAHAQITVSKNIPNVQIGHAQIAQLPNPLNYLWLFLAQYSGGKGAAVPKGLIHNFCVFYTFYIDISKS